MDDNEKKYNTPMIMIAPTRGPFDVQAAIRKRVIALFTTRQDKTLGTAGLAKSSGPPELSFTRSRSSYKNVD